MFVAAVLGLSIGNLLHCVFAGARGCFYREAEARKGAHCVETSVMLAYSTIKLDVLAASDQQKLGAAS